LQADWGSKKTNKVVDTGFPKKKVGAHVKPQEGPGGGGGAAGKTKRCVAQKKGVHFKSKKFYHSDLE